MKCDIIIPVWNQPAFTRDCIESIVRNTRYPYRLIVVDNGSGDETRRYLEGLLEKGGPETELIRNERNLGFVKAVNQGLARSDAAYVCVMNNDTIAAPGWLEEMVEFGESHPEAGLMNPQCDGHGDAPIEAYARMLSERNRGRYMEMNQCQGFCMLIKRAVIDSVGLLDESFGIGGFDDTDYSMRAGLAGYRCVSVHSSYVYHKKHVSFAALGDRKSLVSPGEKEYFRKWPRHHRIAVAFSTAGGAAPAAVDGLLRGILALARAWCWVNVLVLGDEAAGSREIEEASRRIGMPLHQNIKYNFISAFANLQVVARVIERTFGTKRRKRYDAVLTNSREIFSTLRALYPVHRTRIGIMEFGESVTDDMEALVSDLRGPGVKLHRLTPY